MMRTFNHYHPASGTFVRRSMMTEGVPLETDWIEGDIDAETQFVTADGSVGTRTLVTGLAVDKVLITADGTDAATITGLPAACWLRVNGAFVAASGSYAVTATEPSRITVQLVGGHRANGALTIVAGDAVDMAFDADPRWQAMRTATPTQIDNWLAANVTTVAQARQVLRVLILAVRRLSRGA